MRRYWESFNRAWNQQFNRQLNRQGVRALCFYLVDFNGFFAAI